MRKTINFSKSVRNQLVAADIAYSVLSNMPETTSAGLTDLQSRAFLCIKKIQRIHYGGELPAFSGTAFKKYRTIIGNLHKYIDSLKLSELQPSYFNAGLLVVNDVCLAVQKSKNTELKQTWAHLAELMMQIYEYDDPQLINLEAMLQGGRAGERMQGMIT